MIAPIGTAPPGGGKGSLAQQAVAVQRAAAGGGSPGAVPPAGEMGSPAQAVAGAQTASAGDASPRRRGPISWGDREPYLDGGHYLKNMCGTAAPIGAGLVDGGTGSPAQAAVAVQRVFAGHGNPHRRGSTALGDGESCPGGYRCIKSAYRGRQYPSARAHQLAGQGVLPRRWSLPKEPLRGTVTPIGVGSPVGGMGCPA